MKKFQMILANLLLWSALKTKDGQIDLSEEEKGTLFSQLGEEDANLLITTANEELSEVKSAKDQLAELKTQLATAATAATGNPEASAADLASKISALESKVQEQNELINKLKDEPETPSSAGTMRKLAIAVGLATTVFAQGGQILGLAGDHFKVEGRNWNERLLNPSLAATDFSDKLVIEQLNRDLQGYVANYPSEIKSTIFEKSFPEHWKTIYGVSDRLLTATIVVSEVSQPRKANWIAKGNATIRPEVMRVYPVQIDLTFSYWQLQQIETNWLNNFNKEGSYAYKMSFIQFLLGEYIKQAKNEDIESAFHGVHVETPEQHSTAVSYLLRQNGLLKQIFDARIAKKYRAFNVGNFTETNVFDKINEMVEKLPNPVKRMPLQLVISKYWVKTYKNIYEANFNQATDYKGQIEHVKDYPNIIFVGRDELEGTDVCIITFMDNIRPMENLPNEKTAYEMQKDKRDLHFFTDYKTGIGIPYIGYATDDPDLKYSAQMIWTNDSALFRKDFAVPFYGYDASGIIDAKHFRIYPDNSNTTDITKITGNVGDVLVIKGMASLPTDVKLKNNANLTLGADISLKQDVEITLVKTGVDTWKKVAVENYTISSVEPTEFTGVAIDYSVNTEFIYAGTATATLGSILNGSDGNLIRVYGGAAAGSALTIASVAGKITVNSSYVMDSNAKYMDLIFINGVWYEKARG